MSARRHDIDTLRIAAFGLLILYHVGMVYVHDWGWHIKSPHQWEWLQWPMVAVNRWRMDLIFLISGIALGLSRAPAHPWRMGLRRSRLLLIPLVFGMLADWGRRAGITLRRPAAGTVLWPILLLVLPIIGWFAVIYWLEPIFGDSKALFDDWANHAKFFPIFLFGFAIARHEAFWSELIAARYKVLAITAFGFVVYFGLRILGRAITPEAAAELPDWNWRAISSSGQAIYAWSALLSILALAATWLNKPWPWLPVANRAVYPWYILHQSLIVPLAFGLIALKLPGPVEALGVVLGTVLGCAILVHGVILRLPWLWSLFGVETTAGAQPRR